MDWYLQRVPKYTVEKMVIHLIYNDSFAKLMLFLLTNNNAKISSFEWKNRNKHWSSSIRLFANIKMVIASIVEIICKCIYNLFNEKRVKAIQIDVKRLCFHAIHQALWMYTWNVFSSDESHYPKQKQPEFTGLLKKMCSIQNDFELWLNSMMLSQWVSS